MRQFCTSSPFSSAQKLSERASKLWARKRVQQRIERRMQVCKPARDSINKLHCACLYTFVDKNHNIYDFKRQPADNKAQHHDPKHLSDPQFPSKRSRSRWRHWRSPIWWRLGINPSTLGVPFSDCINLEIQNHHKKKGEDNISNEEETMNKRIQVKTISLVFRRI